MADKKIAVILPVTQIELATRLLKMTDKNTLKPKLVIVIDDSQTKFEPPPEVSYEVKYHRVTKWLGVNAYWNLGVGMVPKEFDYITIINDDMTIHEHFFDMAVRALEEHPGFAVSCPLLVKRIEEVGGTDGPIEAAKMRMREGGAFTIRKEIMDKVPPVPKELVMFFGEDWYWNKTVRMGFKWIKVANSRIYHHGSLGVKQRGLKKHLEPDRKTFNDLEGGRVRI